MTKLTDANALIAYDNMAREFIAKVESGQARSVRTYAKMKALLERRAPDPAPEWEGLNGRA